MFWRSTSCALFSSPSALPSLFHLSVPPWSTPLPLLQLGGRHVYVKDTMDLYEEKTSCWHYKITRCIADPSHPRSPADLPAGNTRLAVTPATCAAYVYHERLLYTVELHLHPPSQSFRDSFLALFPISPARLASATRGFIHVRKTGYTTEDGGIPTIFHAAPATPMIAPLNPFPLVRD